MILFDGGHLVSDKNEKELIDFAKKIGLKEEWIQRHRFIHFDLMGNFVIKAIRNGAYIIPSKELVKRYRKGFNKNVN